MWFKQAASILITSLAFMAAPALAQEPTLHDVYQAAESGKLSEAQRMMDQVLRDHPNSAKAHYVEAELLAKQGRLANAEAELNTAQRLAPGLPFASAQAVQELKGRIAGSQTVNRSVLRSAAPAVESGTPWGLVLIGLGIAAIVFLIGRAMTRRIAASSALSAGSFSSLAPASSYGAGGVGPVAPGSAGIGSGILGGLATGAAVGAGMIAGEALMHRWTDGHRSAVDVVPPIQDAPSAGPDDKGGTNFGIADAGSWDDGSSGGGGSDWT